MVKEELVNYFSYYLERGKTIKELRNEALEKGYSKKEIDDSFSALNISTKKPATVKIIFLSFSIFIILIAILVVILLNMQDKPLPKPPNIVNNTEEKKFEQISISTEIFNQSNSGTIQAMDAYFLSNPLEKQNSKKLSENSKNCVNTEAHFSGTVPELNGSLHIEDFGDENCFVSYRSDLTMACNYTKDQMRIIYEKMQEKGVDDFAGPFFYFSSYLQIRVRMLGEIIKSEVNKTYEEIERVGNLTLGENLMAEEINTTFNNPETGKEEIIKCRVY